MKKKILDIIIFLFILTFAGISHSDDISDFQIEGLSIGDSLLNYLKKGDIDQAPSVFYPKSQKFKQVDLENILSTKTYDAITVALKTSDAKYKIHEIKGFKRYPTHKECLKNRNVIVNELKDLFINSKYEINSYEKATWEDKESTFSAIDFYFKSGSVRTYCVNWSKKMRDKMGGFYDNSLTIIIYDNEFKAFLNSKPF